MTRTEESRKQWTSTQIFGEKPDAKLGDINEADITSAVQFDPTGDYIATGDKGGRVILFERHPDQKIRTSEYRFLTEFQAHKSGFDPLTSVEISENVKQITWCKRTNNVHLLLTANDKTIKLWKVYERQVKVTSTLQLMDIPKPIHSVTLASKMKRRWTTGMSILPPLPSFQKIPKEQQQPSLPDTIMTAVQKRAYSNAHAFHIHSLSANSDSETFLSADDLRIYLWHLDIPQQSFNIVDKRPPSMDELTQVITSASFHPQHCNIFIYGSSKGTIHMADMRASALCDKNAKVFEVPNDHGTTRQSFFSEFTNSIADVQFSPDGRYMLSRDYLTLKLWDVNMESGPVETMTIDQKVYPRLPELYDIGYIFDKFECTFDGSGKQFMTGSYNNEFQVYNKKSEAEQYSKTVLRVDSWKLHTASSLKKRYRGNDRKGKTKTRRNEAMLQQEDIESTSSDEELMDYENCFNYHRRALHYSWHPNEDTIAVGTLNNLCIYHKS